MDVLRVDLVKVGDNRQRREFDKAKLLDLGNSIKRNGLFHPIVIESVNNPRLIAGERRLRAVTQFVNEPYTHAMHTIPPGHIPVVCFGELPEIQREEIELEENVIRADLTWKERTDAIARLHNLRTAQAKDRGEKQTFTATAKEITGGDANAMDIMSVRNATLLKPYLDDPDVQKAKTENEALSIVRKKMTQIFNTELAKRFDVTKANTPHSLIHGDCIHALKQLEPGSFDVIITDPPYGINAHKMQPLSGTQSGTIHEYEDSLENAIEVWTAIFGEGAKVCKPSAHLYMFCDFRNWTLLVELAQGFGWNVWPTPIVWYKPGGGMLGDSTRGPRKAYELILFASRGDKRVTGVYLDVIVENSADTKLHAAAKPVEVYTNLLRRSCVPGDKVIDPCAGSGPIFPAANRLRLQATGIETVEVHYAAALQRINAQ